jgi:hypothetical protein
MPWDKVIIFKLNENGSSSPCWSKNSTIAPGSCSVSIQLNPLGNGTFTGRLIIQSNDSNIQVTIVPLSARGDFDVCTPEDLGIDSGGSGCFIKTVTYDCKSGWQPQR